jgi:5-methylcytosine-specific restriction endonuclease McrA
VTREEFSRSAVFERDQWRCGICGQKVDRLLKWPDPMSATLDHVVPISLGGEHSAANTRLAHARCNIRRNNRIDVPEQLALVG